MRRSRPRRRTASIVVGAVMSALLPAVVAVSPSAADCSGPLFDHRSGAVDRGSTLVVTGFGWGDDCHDTGDPPAGEGVLGNPLTDIEVVIRQGEVEHLVAIGFADENYEFEVEVPIPVDLEPGPVEVRVDSAGSLIPGDPFRAGELVVSDTPPVEPTVEAPVHFGEVSGDGETPDAGGEGGEEGDGVEAREEPDDGERITTDAGESGSPAEGRSTATTVTVIVLVVAGLLVGLVLSNRRSGSSG